jgi:pilus assembly protein FimV
LQLLSADAVKAPASTSPTPPADNTLVDGKLPAIDSPSTASTSSAPAPANSVQQNNEAIASIDAKSQAMSQQIALLNEQLKQVQGLITDRNQNIELLQQKIKASNEQTELLKKQLESQNNNFWVQWAPYLLGGAGLLVLILLLVLATRGRNRDQSAPSDGYQLNPAQNKITSESTAVNALKTSAVTPKGSSESQQLAAVAASVLPVIQAPTPPFDSKSIIDEARLLRSYNLNEQALEVLRDGIAQHTDELALYQELANLYAEDGNDAQLNQILAQIDSRFGSEHRPNVQNAPLMSAADSAPSAFGEPYSSPKMGMNDELAGFVPDPLDVLDPHVFSNDSGLDLSSHDLTFDAAPAPAPEPKSAFAADLPPSLDDLTFDLSELEEIKQPSFDPVGKSNDLSLELAESTDEAGSRDTPAPNASPAESALTVKNTIQNDTRLGLAEAFLGVGDQESYRMIADEIESEGDADLIAALRDIEHKYEA